jgi:hypothetical protein
VRKGVLLFNEAKIVIGKFRFFFDAFNESLFQSHELSCSSHMGSLRTKRQRSTPKKSHGNTQKLLPVLPMSYHNVIEKKSGIMAW